MNRVASETGVKKEEGRLSHTRAAMLSPEKSRVNADYGGTNASHSPERPGKSYWAVTSKSTVLEFCPPVRT